MLYCLPFRVFRRFCNADPEAQLVPALLIALARDQLLRVSASEILNAQPGSRVTREQMEALIREWSESRLSAKSVEAITQRVNGTWTQAGYLTGRAKKSKAKATITLPDYLTTQEQE